MEIIQTYTVDLTIWPSQIFSAILSFWRDDSSTLFLILIRSKHELNLQATRVPLDLICEKLFFYRKLIFTINFPFSLQEWAVLLIIKKRRITLSLGGMMSKYLNSSYLIEAASNQFHWVRESTKKVFFKYFKLKEKNCHVRLSCSGCYCGMRIANEVEKFLRDESDIKKFHIFFSIDSWSGWRNEGK